MIRLMTAACTALSVTFAPPIALASQACNTDAMIVFDGSASMAELENRGASPSRISQARRAVADAMPYIAPFRKVGLIVYGPAPDGTQTGSCDGLDLRFAPQADAGPRIQAEIDRVIPLGQTALTEAVALAAETLDYRDRPALIVLVTDGNETCGGSPCHLAAELAGAALDLTVHVIGFRVRYSVFSHNDKGGDGATAAECLPALNGGRYVHTDTIETLSEALQDTLGCDTLSLNMRPRDMAHGPA